MQSTEIPSLVLELRIMDFECDPDEITRDVGIEPTMVWRKGEPRVADRPLPVHKENGWEISASSDDPWNYEEVLNQLLAIVNPRLHEFSAISNKYYCQLSWVIWFYQTPDAYSFPNPQISREQLGMLSVIGATIDFDIYAL